MTDRERFSIVGAVDVGRNADHCREIPDAMGLLEVSEVQRDFTAGGIRLLPADGTGG